MENRPDEIDYRPEDLQAMAAGLLKGVMQGRFDPPDAGAAMKTVEWLHRMAALRAVGVPMDTLMTLADMAARGTGDPLVARAAGMLAFELAMGPDPADF